MLKGQVFAEQIFDSKCFAHFVNTFLAKHDGITKGCNLNYTNDSVTINEGYFVIQGRFLEEVGSTTLNITNATEYCKLVCEIDLSQTNTETVLNQASYKILTSTVGYPELVQQDLEDGDNIYQLEFAKFENTPSGIINFVDTRQVIDFESIYNEIDNYIENLENESDLVFKETGKGLYPDVDSEKLSNMETGATKNETTVLEGSVVLDNFDATVGNPTQNTYTLDFPSGFNKDNCIVKAFGTKTSTDKGYNFMLAYSDSSGAVNGGLHRSIIPGYVADLTKIWFEIYNVGMTARTVYYKIVLEKI